MLAVQKDVYFWSICEGQDPNDFGDFTLEEFWHLVQFETFVEFVWYVGVLVVYKQCLAFKRLKQWLEDPPSSAADLTKQSLVLAEAQRALDMKAANEKNLRIEKAARELEDKQASDARAALKVIKIMTEKKSVDTSLPESNAGGGSDTSDSSTSSADTIMEENGLVPLKNTPQKEKKTDDAREHITEETTYMTADGDQVHSVQNLQ